MRRSLRPRGHPSRCDDRQVHPNENKRCERHPGNAHHHGEHHGRQKQRAVLDAKEREQLEIRAERVEEREQGQRTQEPDDSSNRDGEPARDPPAHRRILIHAWRTARKLWNLLLASSAPGRRLKEWPPRLQSTRISALPAEPSVSEIRSVAVASALATLPTSESWSSNHSTTSHPAPIAIPSAITVRKKPIRWCDSLSS